MILSCPVVSCSCPRVMKRFSPCATVGHCSTSVREKDIRTLIRSLATSLKVQMRIFECLLSGRGDVSCPNSVYYSEIKSRPSASDLSYFLFFLQSPGFESSLWPRSPIANVQIGRPSFHDLWIITRKIQNSWYMFD